MGKVIIILILIGSISAVVAVGLFLLFGGNPKLSSEELEKCNVLVKNSDNGTDIVFFAEDKNDAQRYVDYFLEFSPFNKNKESFNFYYIGGYKPECELYRNVAILCYSRDLIRKAASCPNDHIIVLNGDSDRSIRSSNYLNVMSINSKHPLSVLMHEFGHSFVNLAEEYVPAKIPRNSAGNCVAECDEFAKKTDGCYQGCSLDEYKRSINNGIMRTLSSESYGIFNEAVILEKINNVKEGLGSFGFDHAEAPTGAPTGFAVKEEKDCSNEEYYLIEGNADFDSLKKSVEQGCFGSSGSGGFNYNIVLENKTKVLGGDFNPENIFTSAPGEDEIDGEVFESDKNFFLKAPIIEGAEVFEISDQSGKVVASVPICEGIRGDANGDGKIDISDVNHINSHLTEGNTLACPHNSDFDSNERIDLNDINDLVAFIVSGENSKESLSENKKEVMKAENNCGNGITEEEEVCDRNIQICEVNGASGTQECLSDCSGFNSSCAILEKGNMQELFIEDCNSVNDWNISIGNWAGFNGECYAGFIGESSMTSSKIDVSKVENTNLSFRYDTVLNAGEYFEVDVSGVKVFRINSSTNGNSEIELNASGNIEIKGVCNLITNNSYCKWDDIKVKGKNKVEQLSFFGKINGWFVKWFG